MPLACPQCTAAIVESQRFCRYCGYRLDEGLQDFVDTATYDKNTTPVSQSPGPLYTILSPMVTAPTSPLEVRSKRLRPFPILLAVIVLLALALGFLSYRFMGRPGERTLPVEPALIEDISTPGLGDLSVDDLVQMKIHGIDPEFVRGTLATGFPDVTVDELVQMKIHGIDVLYIKEMMQAGLGELTIDDLVQMKIHGIDPAFVKEMRSTGFLDVTTDDLAQMKIHGIDADFVRDMTRLVGDLSVDDLVQLKIHGIEPEVVRALKQAGKALPSVDDMIQRKLAGELASPPPAP